MVEKMYDPTSYKNQETNCFTGCLPKHAHPQDLNENKLIV